MRQVLLALLIMWACPHPALAQRVIAFNADYIPPMREDAPRLGGAAILVMTPETRQLVQTKAEEGLGLTLRQFRIQAPVGEIVHNVALATLQQFFAGVSEADASTTASTAANAIQIEIAASYFGFRYRQVSEIGYSNPVLSTSTPSVDLILDIKFRNAAGDVVYDSAHPPYQFARPCRQGEDCAPLPRILQVFEIGSPQSGYGDSREVINRALHRAVARYVRISVCEFAAVSQTPGQNLTTEQVTACRDSAWPEAH
jgi:hypothetical protein